MPFVCAYVLRPESPSSLGLSFSSAESCSDALLLERRCVSLASRIASPGAAALSTVAVDDDLQLASIKFLSISCPLSQWEQR
jgi:hypothetical protein